MKSANIAAAIVGAAAIAAFIAAATTAAPYGQCHSQSRYLGNNPNDEADSWAHNNHMARCQYGTDEQTAREVESYRAKRTNREPERQIARREERREVARQRTAQNDWDSRALARAEPRYQQYAVSTHSFCRDLADARGIPNARDWVNNCMRGMISR